MIKKLFSVLLVFLISIFMSSVVFAIIEIEFVKVNGDEIFETDENFTLDVDRGDTLDVKVRLMSDTDLEEVQVEAVLRGIDSDDTVDDITDTFDMTGNVTYTKELTLPLIQKTEQDQYKLRIRISDRDNPTVERTYELSIGTKRHDVEVRDVVLSPDKEVKAGRELLATIRVRNRGDKDEEGIKVVVSIPNLGISATDFIDELEKEGDDDDEATTEEMFLRIPDDAKGGEYEVVVDVFFDEGDKKSSYVASIFVLEEERMPEPEAEEKTIITLAADKQNVVRGAEASYSIALTNLGTTAKTYTIEAEGPKGIEFRVSPNVVVVEPQESKAFTVFASAKQDAAIGEQMFTVTISSNDNILKQLPLTANVQESQISGVSKVKRGLEIGLVVLVILLVIIGLIIGLGKLRGEEEGEGKEGKEYY